MKQQILTYTEAKSLGLKHYFTGNVCPRGHIAERFVTSRGCSQCATEYRINNLEKTRKATACSLKKKPEKYREYNRQWCKNNLDKMRERQNRRYANNVQYRLRRCLRAKLRKSIGKNNKVGSAVRDLGCSIEQLKIHLEKLFYAGMSWNNHGILWEIDHKIAMSKFDLTIHDQVKQACHYTNLQPLLIEDHKIKTRFDMLNT